MKLAIRYADMGTSVDDMYVEIMGWFCQQPHFGFGEIDHAYSLQREAQANGVTLSVEDIFTMKSGGMGWGNIRKDVRKMTPTPTSSVTPATETATESPTESPTDPPAEPSNKNNPKNPKNPKPSKEPKGPSNGPTGGNQNQSCSGSGINATGQSLASRYGVSYGQIMSMYCSGMSWGQIQQQFKQNPKKTPHP